MGSRTLERRVRRTKLVSAAALHTWVRLFAKLNVPTQSVCPHHNAPFEYLHAAYFEPARDVVVWAPRGGGKTRLAAIATLLDLLHKPDTAVRILGGSLDQSLRMWEHLLPDVERICPDLLARKATGHCLKMKTGASCAVLAQSQRAVRGLRVQKLRCDEVELFDPKIWEAAQLVTRSEGNIHGSIDALSTFHRPWGLMNTIVEKAKAENKTVLRWCILDVLEKCPAERDCASCPLWKDCRGIAKTKCSGFFKIDDAIRMKQRVSIETWESEMLCKRPSVQGRVFPTFDESIHIVDERPVGAEWHTQLAIDFGFANAFVCLWVETSVEGMVFVRDEYVQPGLTLEMHLANIEPREKVKKICCDPAGNGPNEQTALSNVALLRKRGYSVRYRKSLIIDGLELIRAALHPAAGPVRLFIHPRCEHLRKAMSAYHYADGRGETPLKDGIHDHPIDALRYYFVNQIKHTASSREY